MSRAVKLGDRVAVVNAAGGRVVGIYTIPCDGYLGYVMLQGGIEWAFGHDAIITPTEDPISQYPGVLPERENNSRKSAPASTRHYVGTRINLREHPELKEQCYTNIRELLMNDVSPRRIAEIVGVSDKTVYNIKNSIEKGFPK